MSKKESRRVQIQKGKIEAQVMTQNQQNFSQHVEQAVEEARMRKDYQSLHYHEPKKQTMDYQWPTKLISKKGRPKKGAKSKNVDNDAKSRYGKEKKPKFISLRPIP